MVLEVEQWLTLKRQYLETGAILSEVRFTVEKMFQSHNDFFIKVMEILKVLEEKHQKGWGYKDNIDKNKDIETSL